MERQTTLRRGIPFATLGIVVLGFLTSSAPVTAQTPDLVTPAEEAVCDDLAGAAFGICNAYCEAQDCDVLAPERPSCDKLRQRFAQITGSNTFPCEDGGEEFCTQPPVLCGDGCADLPTVGGGSFCSQDAYCVDLTRVCSSDTECPTDWACAGTCCGDDWLCVPPCQD